MTPKPRVCAKRWSCTWNCGRAKLHQAGLAPLDAGFAARRQFGNAAVYQDQISALWGWTMWERFLQDLRHGVRALVKATGLYGPHGAHPGPRTGHQHGHLQRCECRHAAASTVSAIRAPGLLVGGARSLAESGIQQPRGRGRHGGRKHRRSTVSVANIADYRTSPGFEDMASYDVAPVNLTGLGAPQRISGEAVTWNYFSVLRVQLGARPQLSAGRRPARRESDGHHHQSILAAAPSTAHPMPWTARSCSMASPTASWASCRPIFSLPRNWA